MTGPPVSTAEQLRRLTVIVNDHERRLGAHTPARLWVEVEYFATEHSVHRFADFGPFHDQASAEQCVLVLAARPDVRSANICDPEADDTDDTATA